ncbi:MAG: hypothetical protein U0235_19335 [Polyangiaceae bacterium]
MRAKLRVHQPRVDAVLLEELFVRALLDELSFVHHEDAIGVDDGREAVRHDDARAREGLQLLLHLELGVGVERARRLVEEQDGRVIDERAREREPLPLTAGERRAAGDHRGVVAEGHLGDVLVDAGELCGALNAIEWERRVGERDIGADRRAEDVRLLDDDAHLLANGAEVELRERLPVVEDGAVARRVEAEEETTECGLARARATDDGDALAGAHGDRDVADHERAALGVTEAHAIEGDLALETRRRARRGLLDRRREHVLQAIELDPHGLKTLERAHEVHDWLDEADRERVGREHEAERHRSGGNLHDSDQEEERRTHDAHGAEERIGEVGHLATDEADVEHVDVLRRPALCSLVLAAGGLEALDTLQELVQRLGGFGLLGEAARRELPHLVSHRYESQALHGDDDERDDRHLDAHERQEEEVPDDERAIDERREHGAGHDLTDRRDARHSHLEVGGLATFEEAVGKAEHVLDEAEREPRVESRAEVREDVASHQRRDEVKEERRDEGRDHDDHEVHVVAR